MCISTGGGLVSNIRCSRNIRNRGLRYSSFTKRVSISDLNVQGPERLGLPCPGYSSRKGTNASAQPRLWLEERAYDNNQGISADAQTVRSLVSRSVDSKTNIPVRSYSTQKSERRYSMRFRIRLRCMTILSTYPGG